MTATKASGVWESSFLNRSTTHTLYFRGRWEVSWRICRSAPSLRARRGRQETPARARLGTSVSPLPPPCSGRAQAARIRSIRRGFARPAEGNRCSGPSKSAPVSHTNHFSSRLSFPKTWFCCLGRATLKCNSQSTGKLIWGSLGRSAPSHGLTDNTDHTQRQRTELHCLRALPAW